MHALLQRLEHFNILNGKAHDMFNHIFNMYACTRSLFRHHFLGPKEHI